MIRAILAIVSLVVLLTVRIDKTPVQESNCIQCHRFIREKKRKPCPSCGSMNRDIGRFTEDGFGFIDELGPTDIARGRA